MIEVLELKIIGLDPDRPPMLQRQPCIDLAFQLSDIAPADWCDEFQKGVGKQRYPIKIDPEAGEFVETWVRTPEEIEKALETVKELVQRGNVAYKEALYAKNNIVAPDEPVKEVSPAQLALDKVVAALNFDD